MKIFIKNASKHMLHEMCTLYHYDTVYTSHAAVVDVTGALGIWVEKDSEMTSESIYFQFSIMADECTDNIIMEELSIF